MTEVKSKATKPRKHTEPSVRLATRFVILCYQHFDLMEKRPIQLSYLGYAETFKACIKRGDLPEEMTRWLWRIWSARNCKFTWDERTQDPIWSVAQAQAARFIEENRTLIAEQELST